MREKLNMPDDALKRFMQAGTFEDCKEVLKATFPGLYPDIQFNQLPDEVNRHMVAVMKRGVRNLYDPPGDFRGFSRIP
ncbi:hypothetical protein SAMN05660649_04275 [Desulfotomaculum arcticum]|uniref:Uncharacterized protein n=1 Tax=Desulfotruncus arcticus DSM 17038 TaxID=1121424 RepID=A0A1I2Y6W9_9FIRM|nr:hypothetical protein [Desulfotruncus arcticus]SFH21423.1 hypothetical protein SAMN05660649_04275 [Desulfotomaculum arcticum] [Desulfotruncus arcticus DSM 17038]